MRDELRDNFSSLLLLFICSTIFDNTGIAFSSSILVLFSYKLSASLHVWCENEYLPLSSTNSGPNEKGKLASRIAPASGLLSPHCHGKSRPAPQNVGPHPPTPIPYLAITQQPPLRSPCGSSMILSPYVYISIYFEGLSSAFCSCYRRRKC